MTATATTEAPTRVDEPTLAPLARVVWVIAAAKVAFFVATAGVWGIHRDEFYYLAGGRRVDWGYVDHPPVTPLLYRVTDLVFGASQVGLHTMPALLGGMLVVVAALLARELGGGRRAQIIAALGVATSPMFLTTSRFLSTVSVDLLLWSIGLWLVLRLLRTGDVRLWVPIGAVAGIGLLNKHTMLFWGFGVIAGLLCTRERALMRNRWFVGGMVLAALVFLPNIVWEIRHGWPTIEFLRSLQSHTDIISNPLLYFPFQLVLLGPVLAFVWIPGVRWLLRSDDARRFRAIAYGYFVILVLLFVLRGKAYYVGSWYPALFAAGAVWAERAAHRTMRFYLALLVVGALVAAPFAIPLVPSTSSASAFVTDSNAELGEMLGWHDMARQVADVAHALPQDDRSKLTILTSNYSEAGALEYWRDELGVPQPISVQNSYWIWGYGDAREDATVVSVGIPRGRLAQFFDDIRPAGTITNSLDLHNKEFGAPVYVCRGKLVPWAQLWPLVKDFG